MNASENPQTPLLSITTHDPGLDRQLRENLRVLRERSRGTDLSLLLDDVLQGRRDLREVARTATFGSAVAPATERAMRAWADLSEEKREELAAEGQRHLEEARAAHHREQHGR